MSRPTRSPRPSRAPAPGDDATIAYGSTLLLAMVLHGWLILAQIGDGDVVGVRADGRAVEPVRPTLSSTAWSRPACAGPIRVPTSGSRPWTPRRTRSLAVLLATDGYGNAQVVDKWPSAFSEDLAWMLRDRDVNWLASQLPSWAARCASSDGSADDTTVALLISPTPGRPRPAAPEHDRMSGSEETTIPAAPHADTVPVQLPVASRSLSRHDAAACPSHRARAGHTRALELPPQARRAVRQP